MPAHEFPDTDDTTHGDGVPHIIYYDNFLNGIHDENGLVDDAGLYDVEAAWLHHYDRSPTWIERLWWRWRIAVNALAFAIPLVMLGIVLSVAMLTGSDAGERATLPARAGAGDPLPTASPVVVGEWPPGVIFVQHTVPAMIKNELSQPGERHGYRFRGAVGMAWVITVEPQPGGALDPQITLYAPSGGVVATNDNRTTGDPSAALRVDVREDGDYRLVVEASATNPGVGAYVVSVLPR